MTFAAVFPGQGSQSVGMLAELGETESCVRETFAEASDVMGRDLWALAQAGPDEVIKQTDITQPLMFTAGVAVWRAWCARGGAAPDMAAGHSLGEYSALVAAGVFAFRDAMALVVERGRLMSTAVAPGEGGMAAILGLEDHAVIDLCESLSGARVVEAVNFNSPSQVVISGHIDALEKACEHAKAAGAKRALLLPVSVPNHSSLMQGVVAPLSDAIDRVVAATPSVPVLQNNEAAVPASVEDLVRSLKQHVVNPVRWSETLRNMRAKGCDTVIEFGPGKVLAGLAKRTDKQFTIVAIEDSASLDKALDTVQQEEMSS